jgi:hypothetical protein
MKRDREVMGARSEPTFVSALREWTTLAKASGNFS